MGPDKEKLFTNWIWTADWTAEDDSRARVVYFRKEIEIEKGKVPITNKIRITADSRYKLYVNGSFVKEGPQKALDRREWFVDTADIAPFLTVGANVVAVEVLRFPTPTLSAFQVRSNDSLYRTEIPHLYVEDLEQRYAEGNQGKPIVLCGKSGWKCFVDRQLRIFGEGGGAGIQAQEEAFGRKELAVWKESGFDDSSWSAAKPKMILELPFSDAPGNLVPSTIPPQRQEDCRFDGVQAVRESGALPEKQVAAAYERMLHGGEAVEISPHTTQVLELSAGAEECGYLIYAFSGGAGAKVTTLCSECYVYPQPEEINALGQKSTPVPKKGDRTDSVNGQLAGQVSYYTVGGYGTLERPEEYEPYWFRTFRYIRLTVETKDEALVFRTFAYRATGYPLDVKTRFELWDSEDPFPNEAKEKFYKAAEDAARGSFRENAAGEAARENAARENAARGSAQENAAGGSAGENAAGKSAREYTAGRPAQEYGDIWDISVRTLKRCMHETYMDCPFYEQYQYAMDSRSEILFTYCISADDRLARQAMDAFRRSARPDGMISSCAPSVNGGVIPGFAIYYLAMVYDHMMYFGDKALVKQHFPAIEGILSFFENHLEDSGIVGKVGGQLFRHKYWSFIDWSPQWDGYSGTSPAGLQETGALAMESLLYLYGLQKAVKLARFLGREGQAGEYTGRADRLKAAIIHTCMGSRTDARGKTCRLLQDGPGIELYSVHCQVFAVLTGIMDPVWGREALDMTVGNPDFAQPSVAFMYYVFRAMEHCGMYEQTDGLWELWRQMLRENMTTCVENGTDKRSDCHAWGSLMCYEIPAAILGVRPAAPGFAKVRITPQMGILAGARGDIATPRGFVHVEWEKRQDGSCNVRYELPEGMEIEV